MQNLPALRSLLTAPIVICFFNVSAQKSRFEPTAIPESRLTEPVKATRTVNYILADTALLFEMKPAYLSSKPLQVEISIENPVYEMLEGQISPELDAYLQSRPET